ncbi:hypothetical protein LCGC14_2361920 [marine sediment metagenome]|uniref:Uncharacterized protein n=1 Tax=marine sediment metagenome TaxID=412755 RepID=A0A0F9C693_9ZZZZ
MQRKIMGTPIVLTVGGEYDGEGEPILAIERADIRRKILTKAAEVFRGVTLTDTDGAWIDANGVVVIERGFQVLVYPNPASRVSMTEFVEFIICDFIIIELSRCGFILLLHYYIPSL